MIIWGGLGVLGLIVLSPIPGWIVLGGMCYGFYRLFRYLKRAYDDALGIRKGVLPTELGGPSMLNQLFGRGILNTTEIATKVQELAMERVTNATGCEHDALGDVFRVGVSELGEFHFSDPTEIAVSSSGIQAIFQHDRKVEETFRLRIRFTVYASIGNGNGNKGAEVTAEAEVLDYGIQLTDVELREIRGTRRVKLRVRDEHEDGYQREDGSISKGEGEGQTIDATKWTSK
jgi:hypothetical protein